jgi:hypothetical protein
MRQQSKELMQTPVETTEQGINADASRGGNVIRKPTAYETTGLHISMLNS